MKFLVLHGPNLNLFGRREPHIHGTTTLAEIDERLHRLAEKRGVALEMLQSNHESVLVDKLQEVIDPSTALLNPAALTRHGVALHDAIKGNADPGARSPYDEHRHARAVARPLDHLVGRQGDHPGARLALLRRRPGRPHRPGSRTEGRGRGAAHPAGEAQGRRQALTRRRPWKAARVRAIYP
jgi:Dehydroquinase class II